MIKKITIWGFIVGLSYAVLAEGLHLFCFYALNSQACGALRIPLILGWRMIAFRIHYFYPQGYSTFFYEVIFSVLFFTVIGLLIGLIFKIMRNKN